MGGPGKMLREQTRRIAFDDELLEALKMVLIERPIGTDRQPDAVQRQRVLLANGRQITVRRAARAHVIFRMNLEEADVRPGLDDRAIVLGLKADAPTRRNGISCGRG